MYSRALLRLGCTGPLAILLVLLPSADTYAQKRVKWKVQSAFPTALDVIGESGPRISDHLKMMSDGTLELRFFEPGPKNWEKNEFLVNGIPYSALSC